MWGRYRWLWFLCGVAFVAGCDLFPRQPETKIERSDKDRAAGLPGNYSMRVPPFIFISDVELRRDQPVFKDLANLREQVSRELKLPPGNREIFVYLFEDKARYEKFIHIKHPELPERRAFFVAQARRLGGVEDLTVYTYLGDSLQQDLRHELTHALLHSVLKNVPIWLDEGLAEYFEVPTGKAGVNPKHIAALRQADVRFDMDRLEKLTEVHQMTPVEYHESWAWVHLMLRSTPQNKEKLLAYLQDLRGNPNPGPLRPRLAPASLPLEQALQTHLAEMERKLPKNATAKR